MTTQTVLRSNKYQGKCQWCSETVPADTGYILKNASGKWEVFHHAGQCQLVAPPAPAAPVAPAPVKVPGPVGIHKLGDDYYKVTASRGNKDRRSAAKLIFRYNGTGKFVYSRGAVFNLSDDTLLTYAEAKAFGLKHSFCVKCGIHLEDALSIVRGIGPVCEKAAQWKAQAPKRTVAEQRAAIDIIRKAGTHKEREDGKFTLIRSGEAVKPLGFA